jgi:preprotein translocase subunit SecG
MVVVVEVGAVVVVLVAVIFMVVVVRSGGGGSCGSSGRGSRRGISDINSSRNSASSNVFRNDRQRVFITFKKGRTM